jgi:hypothetical protein
MIPVGMFAMLLAAGAPAASARHQIEYTQLTIHERFVIRVPARRAAGPPIEFRERRADKCQAMDGVAGAAIVKPDNVDIIYRGGLRIRAELEEACPALDYYGGFYILPTQDGQICAGRDSIRSRAGGECQIKRFHKLVPMEAKR